MRSNVLLIVFAVIWSGCASSPHPEHSSGGATLKPGDSVHIVFEKFHEVVGEVDVQLDEHGDVALPLMIHARLQGLDVWQAGDAIRERYQPDGPTEVRVVRR